MCRVLGAESSLESTRELRTRCFRSNFSWQALTDLAVAHDLLPPLIFSLKRHCLLPPAPSSLTTKERMCHVTSQLTDAYQTHIERQEDLRFQLVAVISALNTERVTPLLLKGAVHLTLDSAEWHQARAMRDLDILVHSSEAQEPLGCCHLWAISRITIPRLSIATCRKCAFQGAAAPSRSISRRSHLTLVPLSRRRRCGG